MTQINVRGCSRGFIICVLYRCLETVQNRYESGVSVQFPLSFDIVIDWLVKAKNDCQDTLFQRALGGTVFDINDTTTYWTSAQQFFCWWKNNIERRSKFSTLQKDANYNGQDVLTSSRSLFCKAAITISLNIKKHFDRFTTVRGKRLTSVKLIVIPDIMPSTMNPIRMVSYSYTSIEDKEVGDINESAELDSDSFHCKAVSHDVKLTNKSDSKIDFKVDIKTESNVNVYKLREVKKSTKRYVNDVDTSYESYKKNRKSPTNLIAIPSIDSSNDLSNGLTSQSSSNSVNSYINPNFYPIIRKVGRPRKEMSANVVSPHMFSNVHQAYGHPYGCNQAININSMDYDDFYLVSNEEIPNTITPLTLPQLSTPVQNKDKETEEICQLFNINMNELTFDQFDHKIFEDYHYDIKPFTIANDFE